ncbi:MAG: glutamate-5-semialdehyde dehydrogenase [Thermoplasmatales archaeon]|nr:glutamate-5-semialdehyde dehydrogenase [Thermoplasmatales archaeon]
MLVGKVKAAKKDSVALSALGTDEKNAALEKMAEALDARRAEVLEANAKDVASAKGLPAAMVKRLEVNDAKIDGMIESIRSVVGLADPVGETLSVMELDEGLVLYKVSCPIGVIGVIFESRPDVVPQIMSLCLKSGNAVVFKGGSEAANSNRVLFDILSSAAISAGVPKGSFVLMESRQDVGAILALDEYIDLLIPRGSNEFVKHIQDNTRIPVLGHASGICHVYVDKSVDLDMAVKVAADSKMQYPAVCNALETLLVHKDVAKEFLPKINRAFLDGGVEVRADAESKKHMEGAVDVSESDWDEEYGDLIVAVKTVGSLEEAVDFINEHGSNHTDAILTADRAAMSYFVDHVDSADVMVNASTRFSDGFRYGKGAEVGISTNKIHSRGPVGMEGLMIYKYVLLGEGQTVGEYSGPNAKRYTHREIGGKLEL